MRSLFKGEIEQKALSSDTAVLDEEAQETVRMLLDPIERFLREDNDAAANDETRCVSSHHEWYMRTHSPHFPCFFAIFPA
jgi:hypothetical protein